jgi:hypothetical protein
MPVKNSQTRNDSKIAGRVSEVVNTCHGGKFDFTALDIQAAIVDKYNTDYSMGRIYKGISAAMKDGLIIKSKQEDGLAIYW